MPEILPSLPEARCSALEEFLRSNPGAESSGLRCPSRMAPSIQTICGNQGGDHNLKPVHTTPRTSDNNGRSRQRGRRPNPRPHYPPLRPHSGRRPGTSKYYGVRFRPDLNKWVAEIRVAEWKAVDKKVWLGTFETEQAAARGVDLARKLLGCTKKHLPNLPCAKLSAYTNTIPRHIVLTDLTAGSMFKETTAFIKHECKQYATSFNDSSSHGTSTTPVTNETSSSSSTRALGYNPSDVFDLDDCDSELNQEYYCYDGATATNDAPLDGFEVDSSSMTPNYNHNYELGVSSSSSPSSCTSLGSCVTLGAFQGPEVALREWEVTDCGGCGDPGLFQCCRNISGMVVMMPEVEEGMAMMETTLAEHVDASAASQQWGEDENSLFSNWPALFPQDSSTPFLNQMPDLASYISPMPGAYLAPGDLDPWMLQGTQNYPFQNGLNGWT